MPHTFYNIQLPAYTPPACPEAQARVGRQRVSLSQELRFELVRNKDINPDGTAPINHVLVVLPILTPKTFGYHQALGPAPRAVLTLLYRDAKNKMIPFAPYPLPNGTARTLTVSLTDQEPDHLAEIPRIYFPSLVPGNGATSIDAVVLSSIHYDGTRRAGIEHLIRCLRPAYVAALGAPREHLLISDLKLS